MLDSLARPRRLQPGEQCVAQLFRLLVADQDMPIIFAAVTNRDAEPAAAAFLQADAAAGCAADNDHGGMLLILWARLPSSTIGSGRAVELGALGARPAALQSLRSKCRSPRQCAISSSNTPSM